MAETPSRVLHEHGFPIDKPVVQYEQWRALTPKDAQQV
jgi:hypothetical protein